MISEAAGAGVIRQDVQQAIEREMRYRLGEGDASGALARWQKELLLLVIQTVKANACLSQLHARAAVKAGATLAQVLQVIQYVELTGMVKWVMVGHDALTAAEADVPEAQRLTPARDAWTGQEQRLQDIQQYLRRDGHAELSPQWQKLAEVAPAILDAATSEVNERTHVAPHNAREEVPNKERRNQFEPCDVQVSLPRRADE
jgi:hypothetical protein